MKTFVKAGGRFLKEFGVTSKQVVNYDECRITVRVDGRVRLKRMVREGEKKEGGRGGGRGRGGRRGGGEGEDVVCSLWDCYSFCVC